MSTVTPANNSNFLGRQGHGVQSVTERTSGQDQEGHDQSAAQNRDIVDLSRPTVDILKSIQDKFDRVLQDHPQYRGLILPKSAGPLPQGIPLAISLLSRTQLFLADTKNQRLAGSNANFASFFDKIKNLGLHNQEALQDAQRAQRNNASGVYKKPPQNTV